MPPPSEGDMAASGGNNSSDFVRKLYKMLEDPAYEEIVRWGNEGTSFVVLENEKFTKTILPKHFKHSNFASFVRQLNKYDFHKVRHTEESGQTSYGQGAWEFKHPEFRANMKDNLDNIRRKAPAQRKQAAPVEEGLPSNQQVSLMNESLSAALQQVAGLQEQFCQVVQTNKLLVDEVLGLQKTIRAQNQVHHEMLNYLGNLDERRRSSRHGNSSNSNQGFHSSGLSGLPDSADEPSQELRRAREILTNTASVLDAPGAGRELERLSLAFQSVASPPESTTSSAPMFNQPSLTVMPMVPDPFSDMKHLVYPIGQNQGIDPFHADHIHNIPYTQPPVSQAMEAPSQITPPPPPAARGGGGIWHKKPRILLVEDDKTCSRIGMKFLSQVDCEVDVADDGMGAVARINADRDRYALIFMDIIMPQLDGVSASTCIRSENPTVPIIAMTSNIRQEDIATYFNFGMNDVLAKPFTKDGMIRILKKHLAHLLRNPEQDLYSDVGQTMPSMAYAGSSGNMSINSMTVPPSMAGAPSAGPSGVKFEQAGGPAAPHGPQLKFETAGSLHSPSIKFEPGGSMHSPTTTTGSWHSPGTMSQTSPATAMDGAGGGYMAAAGSGSASMALTPGGTQRPPPPGYPGIMQAQQVQQIGTGSGGGGPMVTRMAELGRPDDRPEKRQRLYGATTGAFAQ